MSSRRNLKQLRKSKQLLLLRKQMLRKLLMRQVPLNKTARLNWPRRFQLLEQLRMQLIVSQRLILQSSKV